MENKVINKELLGKLKGLGFKAKHNLIERNPYKYELVRQLGDQIDSRLSIELNMGSLEFHYTLWIEGEGNRIEEFPSENEIKRTLDKGNKEYEKEARERGYDEEDW